MKIKSLWIIAAIISLFVCLAPTANAQQGAFSQTFGDKNGLVKGGALQLKERSAAPSRPTAGLVDIYVDASGSVHALKPDGSDSTLGGGGVTSLNSLTGALSIAGTHLSVSAVGSTVTVAAPQALDVTDSPTFHGMTVDSNGSVSSFPGITFANWWLAAHGIGGGIGFGSGHTINWQSSVNNASTSSIAGDVGIGRSASHYIWITDGVSNALGTGGLRAANIETNTLRSTAANTTLFLHDNTYPFNSSSAQQVAVDVAPTANQTSTGQFTGLRIAPYFIGHGVGPDYIFEAGTSSSANDGSFNALFQIDSTGAIYSTYLNLDNNSAAFAFNGGGFTLLSPNTDQLLIQNGAILAGRVVTAKTTDYSVTTDNVNTFFTNTGASGTVNFTLPTVSNIGLTYTFYVDSAHTLQVTAPASTTIRSGASVTAAAGNITNSTVGGCIKLVAISSTQWVAESIIGVWTFN